MDKLDTVNILTDRVKKRLQECHDSPVWISGQRAYSYMKAWRENESVPFHLRRALAFARVLEDAPAVIREGEFIVGSETKYIKGAESAEDFCPYDTLDGLEKGSFETLSEVTFASIEADQKEILEEAVKYWMGKSTKIIFTKPGDESLGKNILNWVTTALG